MLFKDFNEQMDESVLICIVNAHVNPLSRTFLKNLNERCLFWEDHVGKRFRRLNETSCIVNAHVNLLSRTFLKNCNERCLFWEDHVGKQFRRLNE